MIKYSHGNILSSEESMLRRWNEKFEEPMNEENERERPMEEMETGTGSLKD